MVVHLPSSCIRMKDAIQNIAKIKVFLLTSLLYIALGTVLLISKEKLDIHFAINEYHNSFLDSFFKYCTHLGDGLVTAILVLPIGLLFYKKYRYSIFVLGWLSLLFTGFIAQFLKRVVFPNAERPAKFIGEDLLYLVPDVEVHHMNSFPSGHTATAFAFFAFVCMTFFKGNKPLQFIMAIIAVLVGYSRMYLSQHFLEDVTVGAVVGLVAYLISHLITSFIQKKKNIIS